ncbi:glycosyltransferase [Phocaeicola sp.]|uniref:glycosyltransferase n=1 Tax=Phocaeicola sp. TaxID=2773926 RepID=UPI0023C1EF59|nr:glycosyltransferase [Phocaeicola sp.]MDE5677367.1 glycosyltransferase [Phocaeicola sp.]
MKNKNLKVAFFLPTLNIGGIERVFITYANSLSKFCDVEFALCKKEGVLLKELSSDVNVYNFGNVRLANSFYYLRKYLKQNTPDCVITGGDYPNMVLILASLILKHRPKIIISQHNYFNIEVKHLGLWARLSKIWTRMVYPYSHKIIAVSDGIYKYLTDDLKQNPAKIIKIPNPINVEEINEKSKEKCEFDLPDKYIVFIGRLGIVKNIYMLLDSYEKARLNECYLVIVGDGFDMIPLQKYAMKLLKSKYIIFTGATHNPLPVLRNAKSLVLPSFSEAFPTILLEAICLGVPVVATPTEGAKEILNDVPNAYISNSFTDSDEFAKLLEQAYSQSKMELSSYLKAYDEKVACASLISSCI